MSARIAHDTTMLSTFGHDSPSGPLSREEPICQKCKPVITTEKPPIALNSDVKAFIARLLLLGLRFQHAITDAPRGSTETAMGSATAPRFSLLL
jgi:hypothetical protein